jgi:hypothetical protein
MTLGRLTSRKPCAAANRRIAASSVAPVKEAEL